MLAERLRGVADRIAATPVQIEDANTCRQAAAVISDFPKLHAHWLEQLKEELLSKKALQAAADAICLEPPANESDRNEVRIEIEAAWDSIPIEEGGDGS